MSSLNDLTAFTSFLERLDWLLGVAEQYDSLLSLAGSDLIVPLYLEKREQELRSDLQEDFLDLNDRLVEKTLRKAGQEPGDLFALLDCVRHRYWGQEPFARGWRKQFRDCWQERRMPLQNLLSRLRQLKKLLDDHSPSEPPGAEQHTQPAAPPAPEADNPPAPVSPQVPEPASDPIVAAQPQAGATPLSDTQPLPIESLGDRNYRVGDCVQAVESNEDAVLTVFAKRADGKPKWIPLDQVTLCNSSGYQTAPRILKKLKAKYEGMFAQAIDCPGKRGQGGLKIYVQKRDCSTTSATILTPQP